MGKTGARLPAFGTRVKFRRYRLGLIDGAAKMVARRTPKFDSVKATLLAGILNCPACGGVETANHVLLHGHCQRTQWVWDEAIVAATEGAKGTAAEGAWGALDRGSRADHLLGSADFAHGAPIAEVALRMRMRAEATKSLVLGFARVDGKLKVDRAQIRALAKVAVKARRAFDKAAKWASPQGGICPPAHAAAGMPGQGVRAGPQTPAAPGVAAGGPSGGIEHDCNNAWRPRRGPFNTVP